MHKLARLSARERQQIIDDFVANAFSGIDADAPGASIANAMRQMPAELPDAPTAEQVDAWIELFDFGTTATVDWSRLPIFKDPRTGALVGPLS